MEYAKTKLYNELSQFNTFNVNGFICENGAEKQMSPISSYSFNSRSITQNGNFAYAAERERNMSGDIDYYELLRINKSLPKREASKIIRMYNVYKSKIKK